MNTPHHASSIEILKNIALEAGTIVRKGFFASKEITHKGTVDLPRSTLLPSAPLFRS